MDHRWLSVDEIAKHVGVSPDTVYRRIAEEGLPAHKVSCGRSTATRSVSGSGPVGEAMMVQARLAARKRSHGRRAYIEGRSEHRGWNHDMLRMAVRCRDEAAARA